MPTTVAINDTVLFRFEAIGTQWEIETKEPLPEWIQQQVMARIDLFDRTYSRFRADSLVGQMAGAHKGGHFTFPTDAAALFTLYDQLHQLTDGAVDPLIGRQLERLGYDRQYSLKRIAGTPFSAFDEAKKANWATDVIRDQSTLTIRQPLIIDVGAAGKGYLVDLVAGLLLDAGLNTFTVDAGGDIRHYGLGPIRIGLEDPMDPNQVIGVITLHNGALCASATNRRAWGDGLHHILDARLGQPVQSVIATWAMADDALTADGLATALFFTDAHTLKAQFPFSSVRMFSDRTVDLSDNFEGELFYT